MFCQKISGRPAASVGEMMRQAARIDLNHRIIREGLRRMGYFVVDSSRLGRGFPDLVVIGRGQVALLEVKQPGEKLTPAEEYFFTRAGGCPVWVVHSLEESVERLEQK